MSLDGIAGAVFRGEVAVVASPVVSSLDSTADARQADDPVVAAVARLMKHADDVRRLGVRANADTGEDAARAGAWEQQESGSRALSTCSWGIETLWFILSLRSPMPSGRGLRRVVADSAPDFTDLFEAMDGLPVTVRLLDPPLHEFLPDLTDCQSRWRWKTSAATATPNTTGCWRHCGCCTRRIP